jgi:NADH-quinone oxidoreductase subunit L
MWGVTAAVLAVVALAYSIFVAKGKTPETDAQMQGLTKTLYNKYYVDEIYNSLVTKPLDAASNFFSNIFDAKILDGLVNGVGSTTRFLSNSLRQTQTGNVGLYFFAMVVAIILILAFKTF